MNKPARIINPTIDLFLYDLYEGLGQSQEQVDQNRERFWRRIYNDDLSVEKLTRLQRQEENSASYVELLGGDEFKNQRFEFFKPPLDGYYFPVKLGDTFALQIDCSGRLNDPHKGQPVRLDTLPQIKEKILHSGEAGEMGNTWVIRVQLADSDQPPQTVAQECYQQLQLIPSPDWKRDCKNQGTFKGSSIFELERAQPSTDDCNRNLYVLIFVFSHDQSDQQINLTFNQLYPHLIKLFYYRNKIIWMYQRSRQRQKTLKDSLRTIQKIVDSLSDHLECSALDLNHLQQNFAQSLQISYLYQTELVYLKEQGLTIKTNTNYYWQRVQAISELDSESDIAFLEKFREVATKQYLQIKTDCRVLDAELKPLTSFISTVEGIIKLEKTKNERILNQTVAIASVGIGSASLALYAFDDQAREIINAIFPVLPGQPEPSINLWLTFFSTFSLSLTIGLLGAGIVWLFIKKKLVR